MLARQALAPLRRYLARRTDSAALDDVLADTLLVMWRRLDDIPADAPLPWCYGAARRCLANARRAEGRRASLLRRLTAQPMLHPEPLWGAAEPAHHFLAEALNRLPDNDRDVLRLWAWEQLEPREMAVVLGITSNAASIRLHRATRRLRHQLAVPGAGKDGVSSGHLGPRQQRPCEETEAPR